MTPMRDAHPSSRRPAVRMAVAVWIATAGWATAVGLDAPVRASWKGVPLREWAARVASLAAMPVIVDRRIDPDIAVTVEGRGEPLRELLDAVAAAAGAEAALLDSSVRIVPRGRRDLCERADAARAREIARLPKAARVALEHRATWTWPAAARPRDLVAATAAEAGIAVEPLEAVPHDHFPAADLPPLTRAERLDLVLAHFDRRVAWRTVDGVARGVLVPLDTDLPPRRPGPDRKPRPQARAPVGDAPAGEVFSLRLEAPLDEALAALCGRFGLHLALDRESLRGRGIAPREIVRLDVRDLSREQLLDAVLGPLGIAWRIEADRLRVFAPPPDALR